jgi:hypothetical protein
MKIILLKVFLTTLKRKKKPTKQTKNPKKEKQTNKQIK